MAGLNAASLSDSRRTLSQAADSATLKAAEASLKVADATGDTLGRAKNAARKTVDAVGAGGAVNKAADAANVAAEKANKVAGKVNAGFDKMNDAQLKFAERFVRQTTRLQKGAEDVMPKKLQMVMGKVKPPSYFTLAKDIVRTMFCMCACPAYYKKHLMEDEQKEWEEEQRRTHAGVKVEELNQSIMENVVHELVVREGTGSLLKEGSEAHLEICLYAFDGQVQGWPMVKNMADGLPGTDGQRVPLPLQPRQLVSVHPSPKAEELGWKFGEVLVNVSGEEDNVRMFGFFPKDYTVPIRGFLEQVDEFRAAESKSGRDLVVAIHPFDRPDNIPKDTTFQTLAVQPGQLVEVLQEAHGWMQGVSTNLQGVRLTGWLPANHVMKVSTYLTMMVEFEDMIRRLVEQFGGEVDDEEMAPPAEVIL
jgi:hypothetical protein